MNYLVIDLEMCKVPRDYRSKGYKYANETIQIGAVPVYYTHLTSERLRRYWILRKAQCKRDLPGQGENLE